ncbi:unnamed protein product [Vitrella brassicaformis CCMP3155]|uniref:Uncharacterized protein n=1 Tax=Vitrella brassicaformis (strain CCMP3155) TaxID=1169540 RepID=A0A0G4EUW3_VITBC|nr:unnamed protein product [Vitrella brassicaformis CCMP3155]|eukprot:CEM02390.1 unnamed protein product [Vitrella brassicaformis CCMP3155]
MKGPPHAYYAAQEAEGHKDAEVQHMMLADLCATLLHILREREGKELGSTPTTACIFMRRYLHAQAFSSDVQDRVMLAAACVNLALKSEFRSHRENELTLLAQEYLRAHPPPDNTSDTVPPEVAVTREEIGKMEDRLCAVLQWRFKTWPPQPILEYLLQFIKIVPQTQTDAVSGGEDATPHPQIDSVDRFVSTCRLLADLSARTSLVVDLDPLPLALGIIHTAAHLLDIDLDKAVLDDTSGDDDGDAQSSREAAGPSAAASASGASSGGRLTKPFAWCERLMRRMCPDDDIRPSAYRCDIDVGRCFDRVAWELGQAHLHLANEAAPEWPKDASSLAYVEVPEPFGKQGMQQRMAIEDMQRDALARMKMCGRRPQTPTGGDGEQQELLCGD